MGQSQKYAQPTTTTTTDFEQAEQAAFDHVKEALRNMCFCCREDLEQAAFSYYCEGLRLAGVQFREEYARRKATKFADWWHEKHTASKTVRPHTKYSESQALRGRQVAAIRKRGRNDWQALRAQLARASGGTVAEVAGELDCTSRFIYKLSKRKFPKLVALVLALALGVNVGNSSGGKSLPQKLDIDQKGQLRSGTLDEDGDQIRPELPETWPALPVSLGKTGDNAEIVAELSALYPHRAAELAKLPG